MNSASDVFSIFSIRNALLQSFDYVAPIKKPIITYNFLLNNNSFVFKYKFEVLISISYLKSAVAFA